MSDPNVPDYGTRPEPKYGRRAGPPTRGDHWDHTHWAMRTPDSPEPTRSMFGIVLSLALMACATWLALIALQGGWWSLVWILFAPFALFGVAGFIIDVRKVPRDENGRPL